MSSIQPLSPSTTHFTSPDKLDKKPSYLSPKQEEPDEKTVSYDAPLSQSSPFQTPPPPTGGSDVLQREFSTRSKHKILNSLQQSFPEHHFTSSFIDTLLDKQLELKPKTCELFKSTESFPYDVMIHEKGLFVIKSKVGQGGNHQVTEGIFFPTTNCKLERTTTLSPSKPFTAAMKQKRLSSAEANGFSPEQKRVRLATNHLPSDQELPLAPLLTTAKTHEQAFALMPLYEEDLDRTPWETIATPGEHLIKDLYHIATALEVLHSSTPPHVHRDIKPANIVRCREAIKLIDTELLTEPFTEAKRTTGTPEYLNPRSFGLAETSLIGQLRRRGLQRPEDDLYALGVTGIRILINMFKSLIPDTASVYKEIQKLNPRYLSPKEASSFTEEELRTIGQSFPYRAFLTLKQESQKIGIFPTATTYRESFSLLLAALPHSSKEKELLQTSFNLCVDLKNSEDDQRLTAKQVSEQLECFMDEKSPSLPFLPDLPFV
jgi:serine/threonine protein kinase